MITSARKRISRKLLIIALIDIFIIASLILYFGVIRPHVPININGAYIKSPIEIAEFNFIDHQGKPFSKKNLEGHWSMIFFGFTNCPMICPTTMSQLDSMYKTLQRDLPQDKLPHIIFISVDPDRDTVESLNKFVNSFNENFTGIRADKVKTIELEKQLHILVTNSNTINHSMEIMLLNPKGKVQAYFPFPHQAEKLATDYKAILKLHS